LVHLIALSALLLHAQPPPLSDEKAVLGFADSLLAEGDAYRAIGEYKRFLFLVPEGAEADAARFSIGLAYLRGGQPQAAVDVYERLAEQSPTLRPEALLQVGYAHYLGGQPKDATKALTRWLKHEADGAPRATRERARYLLGWAELAQGHGAQAAEQFSLLPGVPDQPRLVEKARALDLLPQRSPVVAGLLSIIPGAGHVYIGQPVMGLAALSWNAAFGFAVYDSIRNGQLGVALILGGLEALWYFGTMFGAVSGANKLNRDLRQNALDDLRETYDDRPESWPPARPVARF
jgi:tetratricopeptide (TPR) repeat protein